MRKPVEMRVQKTTAGNTADNWLRRELVGFVLIKICVLAILWGAVARNTTVNVDENAAVQRLVSVSSSSEQGSARER
jgi:hypothetical protein